MDQLLTCMNALRWSASDGERVHLGERWIERYYQEEAGSRELVLRRLLNAIRKRLNSIQARTFGSRCRHTFSHFFLSWNLRSRWRRRMADAAIAPPHSRSCHAKFKLDTKV